MTQIVVAGSSDQSAALARYLPDGSLDATFGSNGLVVTNFGSGSWDEYNAAADLALQPDGKIVVAGSVWAQYAGAFILARYWPNGTLDSTFSGDGKVVTKFSSSSEDYARALVIQPDGKIVVAGYSYWYEEDRTAFALARYLPTGTLDTSFSSDGLVHTNFGSGSYAAARALALQPNGRIAVAGVSWNAISGYDFTLARYLSNGSLDASFSSDGKATTDFGAGSPDSASALTIQPRDGRLVAAGWSFTAKGLGDFALARYHTITCDGVVATRVGTAGNDTLMGTNGSDVIVGFDGDDTIYGLGGNDLLCGNAGDDTLYGGSANDILDGDSGNDTLVSGTGDDSLRGDAGTDVCDGGAQVSGDTASGCERVTGVP
jgi:uncharacterized delta-60 repeat protein